MQQNEELKQKYYSKHKDQVERLKLERAKVSLLDVYCGAHMPEKVAEEMSSAFRELTARQEKLDLLSSLLACVTTKVLLACPGR
eukprot:768432-Hanusia_phi.AAC.2